MNKTIIKVVKEEVSQLLFPIMCLGCEVIGKGWFCEDCQKKSQFNQSIQFCQICLRFTNKNGSLCTKHRFSTKLTALISYGSLESEFLKQSIHKMKYQDCFDAIPFFTDLLIKKARPIFQYHFTLVVPIPISTWRNRTRGYNQAALIGQRIERFSGVRLSQDLIKIKETLPQVDLNKEERLDNLAGSFVWEGLPIRGRVLLVDDVFTTGSTLKQAALVLRRAGARGIWALTLAHEPQYKLCYNKAS